MWLSYGKRFCLRQVRHATHDCYGFRRAQAKQGGCSAGVPPHRQILSCSCRRLQTGLLFEQIQPGSTVTLLSRLCGGQQQTVSITLQPRIQKDKWSMYWKESMATKTESLPAVVIEADVNTAVATLQQVGWPSRHVHAYV